MNQEQITMAIFGGVVAAMVMAGYLIVQGIASRKKQALLDRLDPVDETTLESALPPLPPKDWSERMDRRFASLVLGSGMDVTAEQIVGIVLLCGVGSASALYLWRSELWLALFGFILGLAVPLGYLLVVAGRRRRQMHDQLPDAIYLLSRSLRAGLGLEQGVHLIATESAKPLGIELKRVYEQVKLGLAVPTALQTAAQRVAVTDFSVFASIIALHRNTGGQLPVLLDRLATGVRDRVQYQGQFRAATSMGRVSAIALGAAVPLIFLWYVLFQPETVQTFLETPGGIGMLTTAFVLEVIGALWLYRLLRTDV
jgi:tight adherence protein B